MVARNSPINATIQPCSGFLAFSMELFSNDPLGNPKNRSERLSSKAHGAQKVRHTVQGRRTFEHRDTRSFVCVAVFLVATQHTFTNNGYAAIQSRSRLLEVPLRVNI